MSTASSGESILRYDCPRAHLASSIFPLRRQLSKILHIYEQLTQIVAAFQSIVSVIGAQHVADSDLPDITVCIHGKPTNSSWSQHTAFSPMHRGLKPLSIRSGANDLPKPRFSCSCQVSTIRAWTQKKRAGRHEFDFATYQSRQISAANAAGSRLARKPSRSATLLRLKSGGGLGAAAGSAAGLSLMTFHQAPPDCFMAYAVFVEFCSKPQSQPITARFLVQISCSWRKENF